MDCARIDTRPLACAGARHVGAIAWRRRQVPHVRVCRVGDLHILDRNAARDVALAWKDSLKTVPHLKVLPSTAKDLEQAWLYFERPDLRKLSAVDAVSFILMAQRRIRVAFAFDSHFATAGFRMVG